MPSKIEKPSWYPQEIYSKKLTAEEWLYEIWKRDKFNRDEIGLPFSVRLLPVEERKRCFSEIIFSNDINNFLSIIKSQRGQAVKPLSVTDIFRMFYLIKKSEQYQNHPDKDIFENAIHAITNEEKLSDEQRIAFAKFYDTPWYFFHEKSQNKEWYPNQDITHLTGIPTSIDPDYAKEDISKQLKNLLTQWVGKLQDIELQFTQWEQSNILAVFDLRMWLKLQDQECSKISLHKLLWPKGRFSPIKNEYVNPDDDIDHCITLSERIISQNVIRALLLLCEDRKNKICA